MPYNHILFEVGEGGVALVTINRPDKLNALSGAVIAELREAFVRIESDQIGRASCRERV